MSENKKEVTKNTRSTAQGKPSTAKNTNAQIKTQVKPSLSKQGDSGVKQQEKPTAKAHESTHEKKVRAKRKVNAQQRKKKKAEIRAAKKEFKKKRAIRRAELKAAAKRKKISLKKEKQEAKKQNALKREQEKQARMQKKQARVQEKQARVQAKKQRKAQKQENAMAKQRAQAQKEGLKQAESAKKQAAKQQRKDSKAERKAERRISRDNRNKNRAHGKPGLIAAVIALSVSTLVLASALTAYYFSSSRQIATLNAGYARAYYSLQGYLDNMDANLSKLAVSSSQSMGRQLTTDIAVQSELAENSLQELPLGDEAKFYTAKLVNQVGDYAKFLQKELNAGTLTEEERETVLSLQKSTTALRDKLKRVENSGNVSKNIAKMLKADGEITKGFTELEENSTSLPRLIYDGAFSESTLNRTEARGLTGDAVSRTQAEKIFRSLFADYGLSQVEYAGESTGAAFTCHCFTAMDSEGGEIYAQITAKGGHLALFDRNQSEKSEGVSTDDCIEKALAFLEKAGYETMEAVWTDSFRGECTVNCAASQEGVTMYPDLIKVKVDCADGKVLGLEAYSYLLNHTNRQNLVPRLSQSVAESKVSDTVNVETRRLCVAPLGEGVEELCYEFSGKGLSGELYYFYISANTGEEVQIFRVIQGTEGTVLS